MAKFLLAGGGTAGHVNPLLATALELRQRGHEVIALGTAHGLERDLVPATGVDLVTIEKIPFPRSLTDPWWSLPNRLRRSINEVQALLRAERVDAVVGFGGYVSSPAYLAARKLGLPIVAHEGNAKPGMANKLARRLGATLAITFANTPLPGAHLIGMPVRAEVQALLATPVPLSQPPRLVVMGGSLGAVRINDAVVTALPDLLATGIQIVHLTGRGKAATALTARSAIADTAGQARYEVYEYREDVLEILAGAAGIVCRAGAVTVTEVTSLAVPALYVPLAHGNGEQALNAQTAVSAGAAHLVSNKEFSPTDLIQFTNEVVLDPAAQQRMRDAARRVRLLGATAALADLVEHSLTGPETRG